MQNISEYKNQNQKQILSYLKLLLTEKCLISANFGANKKDTFLTAFIEVDQKQQTITIDCGPKEYLNKRLLSSPIIKFSTKYQGIKVLFEGRKVKKAGSPSQPSFTIAIPNSIYWIQRRQFYRVKSPLSKNSFCVVSLYNEKTKEETMLKLQLYDISATGFSFINESMEFNELFNPSLKFEQCKLILENEEEHPISFETIHNTFLNPNNPKVGVRIGCCFTEVASMLQSSIIRYMQEVEREIKHKEL
ncbi:MAG: flagellar brake protein [Methylococcales bacterium]|nr:flagellar brake protein [Methylococcales bacterium]